MPEHAFGGSEVIWLCHECGRYEPVTCEVSGFAHEIEAPETP